MLVAYLEGSQNENKISESERGGRESESAPKMLTHFKKKVKRKTEKEFSFTPIFNLLHRALFILQ